jgi:Yip1 domain
MTSPSAEPVVAPPAAKPAPLWEDFIDIFYAPSSVFKRRENQSPWPAILIISALILIVTFATYNAMSGVFETEVRRQLAKNPQMTQDLIDKAVKVGSWFTRLGGLFYPIIIAIAAFFAWLVGKIVGSKQTYQVALVMVGYASIIDVVKAIVAGAQALLMDSTNLTSLNMLATGPARFVDSATVSPYMLAILNRLDLFTIWYTVLLGIGMYVMGKVSKTSAAIFAVIYWLLPTAFALYGAFKQASAAAG